MSEEAMIEAIPGVIGLIVFSLMIRDVIAERKRQKKKRKQWEDNYFKTELWLARDTSLRCEDSDAPYIGNIHDRVYHEMLRSMPSKTCAEAVVELGGLEAWELSQRIGKERAAILIYARSDPSFEDPIPEGGVFQQLYKLKLRAFKC